MSLKEKASRVNLTNIGAKTDVPPRTPSPKTGIGIHADALFRDEQLAKENEHLKEQLSAFKGGNPARRIDPTRIHPSRWANRHAHSFEGSEFRDFKDEIESAGGNVQPIKVRPKDGGKDEYEIVFGHRRHRACLELGLPVLSVVEDIDDQQLFAHMDRENRQRKDLRPFEVGRMYEAALDQGLFPSAKKMAEAIGVDLGLIGKALNLARLPTAIIQAFQTPLDLQYRWASPLNAALQEDPETTLRRAAAIAAREPRSAAAAVFEELTAPTREEVKPKVKKAQVKEGRNAASMEWNPKTRAAKVELSIASDADFQNLQKLLSEFLRGG